MYILLPPPLQLKKKKRVWVGFLGYWFDLLWYLDVGQFLQKLGDPVLRPFLQVILCFNALTISVMRVGPQSHSHYEAYLRQDVVQFGPLVKTLGLVMITKPQLLPFVFKQVNYVRAFFYVPAGPFCRTFKIV